jgi:Polyketide cyclase / dehydrase and lipid transport
MRVTVSTIVAQPAETLFWLSQDYARRLDWDAYLAEAYLLAGHTFAAVGVDSFCKSKSGSVLVSRYISFSPPTHAAVEMTRGPWVLQSFSGTWRFRPMESGRTEVRFIYNFKSRPAILRWLLEPLIAIHYRADMRRRLKAFKVWAEELSLLECAP